MPVFSWWWRLAPVLASGAIACGRNPAPRGWLAPALEEQADPYGAWIVLSKLGSTFEVGGELLAIERDSVFVLPPDGTVRTVPRDSVRRAQIAFYDAQWDQLVAWTGVGAVSTLSNGVLLVFTLPLWAVGGSIATSMQSNHAIRRVDSASAWDAVRMYARFPGGLPENLPRILPPKAPR